MDTIPRIGYRSVCGIVVHFVPCEAVLAEAAGTTLLVRIIEFE
jgi:hypothetical protein